MPVRIQICRYLAISIYSERALTASYSEINPPHLAKMSFGCKQGHSFVLLETAEQVPDHCSPFSSSFVLPGSCIFDKGDW